MYCSVSQRSEQRASNKIPGKLILYKSNKEEGPFSLQNKEAKHETHITE